MSINFFEPLQFTTYMGPEGREWSESSMPWGHLFDQCTEAVKKMRRQQLDDGYSLLQEVESELREIQRPLLRKVLDRFYQGAVGYYAYLIGEADWAHAAMHAGCRAVADAVDQAPFLLPFAHHCKELVTHRARIDRNRRHWQDMLRWIELGRAMNNNTAPLCTLTDGSVVTYDTLASFFKRLEKRGNHLTEEERQSVQSLLDQKERVRAHATFTRSFIDPPGFLVRTA